MSVVEIFNRRWLGPPPLQQQTPLWLLHPDNTKKQRRRYSEEWYHSRYCFFLAIDFQWINLSRVLKGPSAEAIRFYDAYGIDYSPQSIDKKTFVGSGVPMMSYRALEPEPTRYPMSPIFTETDFMMKGIPEQMLLAKQIQSQLIHPQDFGKAYWGHLKNYYQSLSFREKIDRITVKMSRTIDRYTPQFLANSFGTIYDYLFYPWPTWVNYSLGTLFSFYLLLRLEPHHFARRPTLSLDGQKVRNVQEAKERVKEFIEDHDISKPMFWSLPTIHSGRFYYEKYLSKPVKWLNRTFGSNIGLKERRHIDHDQPWTKPLDFEIKQRRTPYWKQNSKDNQQTRGFSTSFVGKGSGFSPMPSKTGSIYGQLLRFIQKHDTTSFPSIVPSASFSSTAPSFISSRSTTANKLLGNPMAMKKSCTSSRSFLTSKSLHEEIDLTKVKMNFIESEGYNIPEKELKSLIKVIGGKVPSEGLFMPPKKLFDPAVVEKLRTDPTELSTLRHNIRLHASQNEAPKLMDTMSEKEACSILGLEQESLFKISKEELEEKFNSLSTRVHPDLGSGTKFLAQKVNEAYDVVKKLHAGASHLDVQHGSRFTEKKLEKEKVTKRRVLSESEQRLRDNVSSKEGFILNRLTRLARSGKVIDTWPYVTVNKKGKIGRPKFKPIQALRGRGFKQAFDSLFGRFYPTPEERAAEASKQAETSGFRSMARTWYSKLTKSPPPF